MHNYSPLGQKLIARMRDYRDALRAKRHRRVRIPAIYQAFLYFVVAPMAFGMLAFLVLG